MFKGLAFLKSRIKSLRFSGLIYGFLQNFTYLYYRQYYISIITTIVSIIHIYYIPAIHYISCNIYNIISYL